MTNFQKIKTEAEKLDKFPASYKSCAGKESVTYYTDLRTLIDIYLMVGTDNSLEKELRNITDTSFCEFGFEQMALFTDKLTGESIAILGTL